MIKLLYNILLLYIVLMSTKLIPVARSDSLVTENPLATDWPPLTTAPSVMVAIFVRNKGHCLPYFLYYIENLDYPKDRMRLWIRTDHNIDNSAEILRNWVSNVNNLYNDIDYQNDNSDISYSDETSHFDWSKMRVNNILRLRQEALNKARNTWADYLFFVDADNFLVDRQILKELIKHDKPIIGPMLNVTTSNYYTNFWGDIDENGYYKRSEDYSKIHQREKLGIFHVSAVHSTFLIQIRLKIIKNFNFYPPPPNYLGPHDDIIIFIQNAIFRDVPMFLINYRFYGYMMMPTNAGQSLDEDKQLFLLLLLDSIVRDIPLEKLKYLGNDEPVPSKLGFDEIYMINLARRPDRKQKMMDCFRLLGIQPTIIEAVDGKLINSSYIKSLKIKVLSDFADPYHGTRTMTLGEIGCFLSHYFIWLDVLAKKYEKVIVFEDDIRFRFNFINRLNRVMHDLKEMNFGWDLLYLGRKRLFEDEEPPVGMATNIVWPKYSYWTLGYALSYQGAWKLIQGDPLKKMIPVDEYFPIMFDVHPREDWKNNFNERNLVAISTNPLLIEPTLYTGEPGYITDTEDSPTIDSVNGFKRRGDGGEL